jgi:hypothetical protein
MPSQFLRLTGFPKEPGRSALSHEHGAGMLGEAWRLKGSTPHIRRPKPPNQIFGHSHEVIDRKFADLLHMARDPRGAPLKRNSIVVYAAVVSYPIAWRALEKQDDIARYLDWRTDTLEWLKTSFGEHLQAVLEHVDERYPHLHAVILPKLTNQNRIDHTPHPGYAARMQAKSNGAGHKEQERVYREGMRCWQDQYHSQVSARFGHARIGPKRKRWRRDDALARQAAADALSCIHGFADKALALLPANPALAVPALGHIKELAMMCQEAQSRLSAGGAIDWREIASLLNVPVEADGVKQEVQIVVDNAEKKHAPGLANQHAQTEINDDLGSDDLGSDDLGPNDLEPDDLDVNKWENDEFEVEMAETTIEDEESEPDFTGEPDWDRELDRSED